MAVDIFWIGNSPAGVWEERLPDCAYNTVVWNLKTKRTSEAVSWLKAWLEVEGLSLGVWLGLRICSRLAISFYSLPTCALLLYLQIKQILQCHLRWHCHPKEIQSWWRINSSNMLFLNGEKDFVFQSNLPHRIIIIWACLEVVILKKHKWTIHTGVEVEQKKIISRKTCYVLCFQRSHLLENWNGNMCSWISWSNPQYIFFFDGFKTSLLKLQS